MNKIDYKSFTKKELNLAFKDACDDDNLELVKYLLTSKELKKHADIKYENSWGFRCSLRGSEKEFNVMKYLLTSTDLKERADIHCDEDSVFVFACKWGNIDAVKYLTTSPDLKEHANIHARNNAGFRFACEYGNIEIVKFLTSSPEIKNPPDIYAYDFANDALSSAYNNNHFEVVDYLLYDLKYDVNKSGNHNHLMDENIISMVKKRNLFLDLDEKLKIDLVGDNKKLKI